MKALSLAIGDCHDTLIEGEAVVPLDELLEKERGPQEHASVYLRPNESRPSLSKLKRENEKLIIE